MERVITIADLPVVRGEYIPKYSMAKICWFKVGGAADILYKPCDIEDLVHFISNVDSAIPRLVVGNGSNILVRDSGIRGVVIKPMFNRIQVEGNRIIAGAGAMDIHVARAASENGIGGLEFLAGIPGSIGGGVYMNAGCYGREFCDIFIQGIFLDVQGKIVTIPKKDMEFGYRACKTIQGLILLEAELQGYHANKDEIRQKISDIQMQRRRTQPLGQRTCGSTFANPPGRKAWELIQGAGCANLKIGGAMVSPLHSNFIVNDGTATSQNVEDLIMTIKSKVLEHYNIELAAEIVLVG